MVIVAADVVIRLSKPAAIAIAAAAGLVLVAIVVLVWRSRRALVRRVGNVALRLEDSPPESEPRGLEKGLVRLERAADGAVLQRGNATVAARRMKDAIDAVESGVVITDENGVRPLRNVAATTLLAEPYGDGTVGDVVDELCRSAIDGRPENRTLELFGPVRRTLQVTVVPIDDERRTIGAIAVLDDLTERRRTEAIRRDFVANVTHELKNPVAALALLAETLQDEDDPAVAQRLTERLSRDAIRIGRTIDDLLELSRIEAEQAPVREPVPVHLVVAEAVERVRPAAEQSGVEVRVNEARHDVTVAGDRRQIVSALHNLLDNAVKYSELGSYVEVRVSVSVDGGRVAMEVRDHGAGIPSRDHERVFERFYRVDRGTSDVPGTGLGLAIVRHVADNLGGEVRLQSVEGEGSTFTLVLPAGPGAKVVVEDGEPRAG